MIKEQRKYCYGVYTLMFLLMCIVAFLPFFTEGKSFVWGAGVEDGLSQHFSALAYYGEALREFFRNLLAGHPKLVMWDMSLGYGADILSTLNYYAIGDPLNLLYGFVSPKNTDTMYDFMILLRMYLAGSTFIIYARNMKKRSYGTVIGALVYVFSGFCFRLGLRHPFFINPMIYFPLLCLGIEKIYQRERPYVFMGYVRRDFDRRTVIVGADTNTKYVGDYYVAFEPENKRFVPIYPITDEAWELYGHTMLEGNKILAANPKYVKVIDIPSRKVLAKYEPEETIYSATFLTKNKGAIFTNRGVYEFTF